VEPRDEPVSTDADDRDDTLVCGTDPYASKGTRDIGRAYLRRPGPTVQDTLLAERTEAELSLKS
jgi:hypothetical protein